MSAVTSNLELDKLIRNDYLNVKISLTGSDKSTTTIRAIPRGEFGFTLGNKWNSLVDFNSIPGLDMVGGLANVALALTGGTQASMQSLWMTTASWGGSEIPNFQLNLTIPTYSRQMNPLNCLLFLARGALPPSNSYNWGSLTDGELSQSLSNLQSGATQGAASFGDFMSSMLSSGDLSSAETKKSEGGYNYKTNLGNTMGKMMQNMFLEAPLGYGLSSRGDSNGNQNSVDLLTPKENTTFTIQVGKWFRARNLVINSISPISFSPECVSGGMPLYLDLGVSFRPYKLPTYQDFKEYFLFATEDYTERQSAAASPQTNSLDIKDNPNILSGGYQIDGSVTAGRFDDMIA